MNGGGRDPSHSRHSLRSSSRYGSLPRLLPVSRLRSRILCAHPRLRRSRLEAIRERRKQAETVRRGKGRETEDTEDRTIVSDSVGRRPVRTVLFTRVLGPFPHPPAFGLRPEPAGRHSLRHSRSLHFALRLSLRSRSAPHVAPPCGAMGSVRSETTI